MTDYLFFVLLGTGAAAIIAAFGLGLVVTYQGSGLVNFGYGAMATWSAYVYADLRQGSYPFPVPGLPDRYHFGDDVGIWWAFGLALLTAALMGLLVYTLVFRPLYRAPALAKVVASIGLVIVFTSLIERRFEDNSDLRVDAILPREPVTIMDGVTVPRDGLWLVLIVLLMTAGVWAASRYTRLGLATKAAAGNEKGAILLGYSPQRLAQSSFVLASLIGAVVVILASPMIQLSSGVFTFGYLIPALGAALIGAFTKVWPTVLTGLAIGLVQSSFTKMQIDFSWFPQYGAREGLPFIVIIVAMVFLGERLPDRGSVAQFKMPAIPPAKVTPLAVLIPVVAAVVGLLVLGPLWRGAIMTTTVFTVLALSLVLLSGFGGQPSLAQMAFAGVAGFSLSKLAMQWDIPFPLAPILASLVAMVFGVIVGIPALRVRGTNLAIITLAGAVAISEFIFKDPRFVGDASTGGAKIPNPKLGDWDLGLILGNDSSRPVFGILLVAVGACVGDCRGQHPQERVGPSDVGHPIERASRQRQWGQHRQGEAGGVRRVGVHRGRRRLHDRLPIRERVGCVVRGGGIAHRLGRCLSRRDHLRERRGHVGHHRRLGGVVLPPRYRHGGLRRLGSVHRWPVPDPHCDPQPGGDRRWHPGPGGGPTRRYRCSTYGASTCSSLSSGGMRSTPMTRSISSWRCQIRRSW